MPFFLEYSAGKTVGRFTLEEKTADDALSKARTVVGELQCISAALYHSDTAGVAYGSGTVVAVYSPAGGWEGEP
ncbi:hypothetical protein [Paenarthrobacter ureafaciens]|uniref:hypothetical protein n=1 Tax=Paenarthrobacter ureafaciens TaxID=37931 RepID=UPI00140DF9BC|nr:hypothetical protein [Paenarthrobacter ureafaciens]MCX8453694.1 hypothetical protein [Paenarthrobacter ureafaciens]MCY0973353.1 hypothetical protein [Paenarthrobacter ureafaciens]